MALTLARNPIVLLLAVLSLTVATASALMLAGMLWPLSSLGRFAGGVLPITEVHSVQADRALDPPRGQPPDWTTAERQTWAELRIAPTRAGPWMRLAYIDAGQHGGALTGAGLSAIQHAYDFTPYDWYVGAWRLGFIYNHWDQVTPDIRKEALDETAVLWRYQSQTPLKDFPRVISNPAGRMAITLAIANLNAGAEP